MSGSEVNKQQAKSIARASVTTIAGLLLSSKKDLVQVAARLTDEALKGQFSQALADTYTYFMKKGAIDPNYLNSASLTDLAPQFGKIANERFSIDQLNHIRKILVNIAKDNGKNSYKKYLLDIALEMDELEFKILLVEAVNGHTYRLMDTTGRHMVNYAQWAEEVARTANIVHAELVSLVEPKMRDKKLLRGLMYSDGSGAGYSEECGRLTPLGFDLYMLLTLEDDPFQNTTQ